MPATGLELVEPVFTALVSAVAPALVGALGVL